MYRPPTQAGIASLRSRQLFIGVDGIENFRPTVKSEILEPFTFTSDSRRTNKGRLSVTTQNVPAYLYQVRENLRTDHDQIKLKRDFKDPIRHFVTHSLPSYLESQVDRNEKIITLRMLYKLGSIPQHVTKGEAILNWIKRDMRGKGAFTLRNKGLSSLYSHLAAVLPGEAARGICLEALRVYGHTGESLPQDALLSPEKEGKVPVSVIHAAIITGIIDPERVKPYYTGHGKTSSPFAAEIIEYIKQDHRSIKLFPEDYSYGKWLDARTTLRKRRSQLSIGIEFDGPKHWSALGLLKGPDRMRDALLLTTSVDRLIHVGVDSKLLTPQEAARATLRAIFAALHAKPNEKAVTILSPKETRKLAHADHDEVIFY